MSRGCSSQGIRLREEMDSDEEGLQEARQEGVTSSDGMRQGMEIEREVTARCAVEAKGTAANIVGRLIKLPVQKGHALHEAAVMPTVAFFLFLHTRTILYAALRSLFMMANPRPLSLTPSAIITSTFFASRSRRVANSLLATVS